MIFGNEETLESKTAPMLRTGTVSSVNKKESTVKVYFEDRDNSTSGDLRVVTKNTMKKKFYWMPEVDEQVLCLFDPRGGEDGYVIGSFYSDVDKNPAASDSSKIDTWGIWLDSRNYIYFDDKEKQFVIGHQKPVKWVDT